MENKDKSSTSKKKGPVMDLPSPDSAIGSPDTSSSVDVSNASLPDTVHEVDEAVLPDDKLEGQEVDLVIETDEEDEEEGEDSEEDDGLSESEIVVTGSMQFALTPAAASNINGNSDPATNSDAEVNTDRDCEALQFEAESPDETIASSAAPLDTASEPLETAVAALDTAAEQPDTAEESSTCNDSQGLPSTVARLEGPGGCEVFVVGTGHFSKESQQDVVTTIERVRPDVLVLELCKARTAILSLDEETILLESKNMDFNKMMIVLRQHGRVQGVLYLLLLSLSAHITEQLGMAPGGEFRAAVATVKRVVPNCCVQLGDRPINVTLGRALAALSPWAKVKLAFHIITCREPISKEDIDKCKDKDMLEELLSEMTGHFPVMTEVFVTERDKFLANSLQVACTTQHGRQPRRVVGVLGIGHLKGVQEHWGKLKPAEILGLLTIPPPSLSNRVVSKMLRVGMYGLIGFALYRLVVPTTTKQAMRGALERLGGALVITMPVHWCSARKNL